MSAVLAAYVGDSGLVFAKIMELYGRPGMKIVDVTYGQGVFWRDVKTAGYKLTKHDLTMDGVDFAALPHRSGSFDMVVFDPPYALSGNGDLIIGENYNVAGNAQPWKVVPLMYRDGLAEAWRVLRWSEPGKPSLAIVKGQDQVVSGNKSWQRYDIKAEAEKLGFRLRDQFLQITEHPPVMRHTYQHHTRSNFSSYLVFEVPTERQAIKMGLA